MLNWIKTGLVLVAVASFTGGACGSSSNSGTPGTGGKGGGGAGGGTAGAGTAGAGGGTAGSDGGAGSMAGAGGTSVDGGPDVPIVVTDGGGDTSEAGGLTGEALHESILNADEATAGGLTVPGAAPVAYLTCKP